MCAAKKLLQPVLWVNVVLWTYYTTVKNMTFGVIWNQVLNTAKWTEATELHSWNVLKLTAEKLYEHKIQLP